MTLRPFRSVCSLLNSVSDSVSQAEENAASAKKVTDRFSFSNGAGSVSFHAWDTGMQLNIGGKVITVDKNGINFYIGGEYIWHK